MRASFKFNLLHAGSVSYMFLLHSYFYCGNKTHTHTHTALSQKNPSGQAWTKWDEYCVCWIKYKYLVQHSLLLVLSFFQFSLSLKANQLRSAIHSSPIVYSYVNCIGDFSSQREEVDGQNLSLQEENKVKLVTCYPGERERETLMGSYYRQYLKSKTIEG
jgi:hypothetical protein